MDMSHDDLMAASANGLRMALTAVLITIESRDPGFSAAALTNLEKFLAAGKSKSERPELREEAVTIAKEYFSLATAAGPHFDKA